MANWLNWSSRRRSFPVKAMCRNCIASFSSFVSSCNKTKKKKRTESQSFSRCVDLLIRERSASSGSWKRWVSFSTTVQSSWPNLSFSGAFFLCLLFPELTLFTQTTSAPAANLSNAIAKCTIILRPIAFPGTSLVALSPLSFESGHIVFNITVKN